MTENIEETTYEVTAKSELQKLQREVDHDCSVNDYTSDIVGAWTPEWIDEWIAAFLPNHPSLRKDSQ
jgi:hypothetical protein